MVSSIKINNYGLRKDPTEMGEEYKPDYEEVLIPTKGRKIIDKQTIDESQNLGIYLIDNEVDDIIGMLRANRIFHLSFKKFNGFCYLTGFNPQYEVYRDNLKIVKIDLTFKYLGKDPYLALTTFRNYQHSDYGQLIQPGVFCLPSDLVSKVTLTHDGVRTGNKGNIYYYRNPTENIFFKASKNLFNEYFELNDGSRFYNDKPYYNGNININNYLHQHTIKGDADHLIELSNGTKLYDEYNHLLDDDVNFKIDSNELEFKLNQTRFVWKFGQPHMEILESKSNILYDTRRFSICTHYSGSAGDKKLTTQNPSEMVLDRSIPSGDVPTQLKYINDPGFIHWGTSNTDLFVTSGSRVYTHPANGFNKNTKRNFIHIIPKVCYYRDGASMTKVGSWTDMGDGETYKGVTSYTKASASSSLTYSPTLVPTTMKYDVYAMVRNCNSGASMSFKLVIDGVDKVTSSFATGDGANAHHVYLGNHTLSAGSHSFALAWLSGQVGIYYILIVPSESTSLSDYDSPYVNVRSCLSDMQQNYSYLE